MFGSGLCPPALIYLIFSISQVVIDTVKGFYNTALVKMILAIIFTFMLNYLCSSGLGILSWLIVFIPFILMTVIVTMLLFVFNLDPKTGRLVRVDEQRKPIKRDLILYHEHKGSHDGKGDGKKCEEKEAEKQFYKLKLDEELKSNYNTGVQMPPIRDQRLAKYN
jgi:predicted membrane protein